MVKGELAGREDDDEIIVFKSVGVAAQDLVTAKVIYDRAVAAGAGWNGIKALHPKFVLI